MTWNLELNDIFDLTETLFIDLTFSWISRNVIDTRVSNFVGVPRVIITHISLLVQYNTK